MPGGRGAFSPVQTMDLGPAGNPRTFSQTTLPQGGQLGMLLTYQNQMFRLVQWDQSAGGTVDGVDGGVAYWEDRLLYTVHFDESAGEGQANGVAGGTHAAFDVSSFTVDQFIFVQVGGTQLAVFCDGSTVAGDTLAGGNDNQLTRTAEGNAPVDIAVAVALSTVGTTTSDEGASLANSSKVRWIVGAVL